MSSGFTPKSIHFIADRLLWGLQDTRNRLIHLGWWPTRATSAVSPDGAQWSVKGLSIRQHTRKPPPKAAVLPTAECIWGQVQLPGMSGKQLPAAVREAMWQRSPIAPDQMLCGWVAEPTADGGWHVSWGLAPLATVVQLRTQFAIKSEAPTFLWNSTHIFPVRDQAFSRLQRRQVWFDTLGLLAVVAVAAALAGLALIPPLLQRQGVVEAVTRVNALEPLAAPIRQQLDDLRSRTEVLNDVRAGISTAIPVAHLFDTLAAALPDDTVLERIDLNGPEIRIAGLTPNATDLLSHISKNPNFSAAKATNAAVRDGATNKERFTFELRLKSDTTP